MLFGREIIFEVFPRYCRSRCWVGWEIE